MGGAGGGGEPWSGPWAGGPASAAARASAARSPAAAAAAAPPVASASRALHLTVELRTARAVTVQLDLSPGDATTFEVYGLLAPAAAAAPPITDVRLTVADAVAALVGSTRSRSLS